MKPLSKKRIWLAAGLFLSAVLLLSSSILVYIQLSWFYLLRIALLFAFAWLSIQFIKTRPGNISLLVLTILFLFFLTDTGFSFRGQSHGVEQSLSHQIWYKRHWQTNAQGFRDANAARNEEMPAILFIGDSYTAGYGIKDTTHRFSNLLKKDFPDRQIMNLGVPGEGISTQMRLLIEHVRPGDVVVWQYFGDDITGDENVLAELMKDEVLVAEFMRAVDPLSSRSIPAQLLIRLSFLANYLYWDKYHPSVEASLIDILSGIYADEGYFSIHAASIRQFIAYCQEKEVPLLFVMMPILVDETTSVEIYEERVIAIAKEQGLQVLQVGSFTKSWPVSEKVVNSMDAHANEKLHHEMALRLRLLIEQELEKSKP
jgi:hypothetical protein